MDALFVPFVISFTVVASVAFGIMTAYFAVTSILQAFGRTRQLVSAPRPARIMLVPSQNHASGD